MAIAIPFFLYKHYFCTMKKILMLLIGVAIIYSCDSTQKDLETLNAKREKIHQMQGEKDINSAKEIDKMYNTFYDKHPTDTNIPNFLFEHADLQLNVLTNPEAATELLIKLYSKYPEHNKAPMALYLCAFTQETQLKRLDLAKAKYELLVKKYPKHKYSKDALKILFWWNKGGTDAMAKHMIDSLQSTSSGK